MKTKTTIAKLVHWALITMFMTLITTQHISAQSWYDAGWLYRSQVAVPNPGATELIDFQVQINLNVGNFDFTKALPDGSDIRVTASDGTTLIPFWLESITPTSAIIWVKIPSIPVSGTTIHLYYANPSPTLPSPGTAVETPPAGPFTRAAGNPIDLIGDPSNGAYLLAENIVYDDVTGHYWMVFANYRNISVGLAWSDDPTNPGAWHALVDGDDNLIQVVPSANAPHIIKSGDTWYIFYADRITPAPWPISVATASSVDGPYTRGGAVLNPGAVDSWDAYRVDEPYVFQHTDGTWYLVYMGDEGYDVEQIGYATSNDILGPYNKSPLNPVLKFGDSFDHGTIADPWIYEFNDVYYIGYTVSGTGSSPWKTALASTTDWTSFTKHGVVFPLAESGFDALNSFRGAVTRIGNTYVLSYTGGTGIERMGIATQPVYQSPTISINDPDAVFDFYDAFGGSALNTTKWTIMNGEQENAVVGGGILDLASGSFKTRIFGNTSFGPNTIYETRARHPDHGTNSLIMQLGFVDYDFLYPTRILDDAGDVTHWLRHANYPGAYQNPTAFSNPPAADDDWHIFRIYRNSTGVVDTAGFRIDNYDTETQYEGVPTRDLPPYVDSYGLNNNVEVDWVRVRKWAGADPVLIVGPGLRNGQNLSTWTGTTGTEWSATGNWNPASLPGSTDYITIPDVANDPISTDLTIGPSSSLNIETGGALTVSGNLVNNGNLTIQSSGLTSSGSLIVSGTSAGNVTYNRQMRTEANDGDYHYFSSPVASNSTTNSTKVDAVWQWNEVTGGWSTLTMSALQSGKGYNLDQTATSDGLISFTGPIVPTDPVVISATSPYADVITTAWTNYRDPSRDYINVGDNGHSGITRDYSDILYGGGGWNMLGNPYTSAILVSDFITANSTQFDPNYVAVYLYDGASAGHTRYYYIGSSTGWGDPISQTHVQVGQGFFVLAMNDYSTFSFNTGMQRHSTSAVMLKSAGANNRWPGLQLKVKADENENMTTIIFNEDMTIGLDPGYDVGLMSYGPGAGIYTALVEDNGINFTRQALPINGFNKHVVPIGIDFENGGEVTIAADIEPLRTFKFILEDRLTGILTDLNTKSYKVTLPAKSYGTGRFFLHVTSGVGQQKRSDNANLMDVRIWASPNNKVNIQGIVGEKATCRVFDLNGRKVFEHQLSGSDYHSFNINTVMKGVYIVQITDGLKVITQRIVFP